MTHPSRQAGDPVPTGRPGRTGRTAPRSSTELPAPATAPPRPGSVERLLRTSVERLLASVDAELPGHLRRLAAASRVLEAGRGVRVGVFPGHVLVECRAPGRPPQHYALAWRIEGDAVAFGDELLPLESVAERLGDWGDLLRVDPSRFSTSRTQETHDPTDPDARLEQFREELRHAAAERVQLARRIDALLTEGRDRLPPRGPTSTPRRTTHPAADEAFIRAVRRR
jgi:hypothetical protein